MARRNVYRILPHQNIDTYLFQPLLQKRKCNESWCKINLLNKERENTKKKEVLFTKT